MSTCITITINGRHSSDWRELRKRIGLKGARYLFHIEYGDYVCTDANGQWTMGRNDGTGLCTCLVDTARLAQVFPGSSTHLHD